MTEQTQRKIAFCKNLMSIRNRVIKSDGSLAGSKKNHFDVSDIDLKRVWESMTGNTRENLVAKEAVLLLENDVSLAHILLTMARNAKSSLDQLADMVSDSCECSVPSAQSIVKCMKENGLDSVKTLSVLEAKVARGGLYSVRGVPFGPEMAKLVSDACMISARANCEDLIEDESNSDTLDYLTDAFNANTADTLKQAYSDLRLLDKSMVSNGSATSITGHATRIAHRYWFQRGICPYFMKETLCRLVVKTAMSRVIANADREILIWAFDAAADLADMVQRGVPVSEVMVTAAVSVRSMFDAVYDKYNSGDVFSYISLMFSEHHGDLKSVSALFSAAAQIVKDAKTGADPDDVNSVIVNRPGATKQSGGATVHTGFVNTEQGDLFSYQPGESQSNFDLLIDPPAGSVTL